MDLDDYLSSFKNDQESARNNGKARALELALEMRKIESQLHWKKAVYFGVFIVALFGGYGLVQKLDEPAKALLSVLLSCLGLVVSFGWYCANRASNYWQQNWDNHVDILEDAVMGPLNKVAIEKVEGHGLMRRLLTGPADLSISKINQMISLYIVGAWVVLIIYGFDPGAWRVFGGWLPLLLRFTSVAVSIMTCWGFVKWGRGTAQGVSGLKIYSPRTVRVARYRRTAPAARTRRWSGWWHGTSVVASGRADLMQRDGELRQSNLPTGSRAARSPRMPHGAKP
jgi:hypothetical protein